MPKKLSLDELIVKSRKIHGEKYSYNKFILVNSHTKGIITCPIHGDFEQSFDAHIHQKSGCPICAIIGRNNKNRKFTVSMLKENDKKYNFDYNYSKFTYNGYDISSIVICPLHGEFKQTWHHLKYGHGCPICGSKKNYSELKLKNILEKEFSNVDYQKRFEWLGRQSLDFYLPDYNVAIEYQGRQHFCNQSLFDHSETLKCDLTKMKKCKEHSIQIYYITFEEKYIPLDFQYYKLYINIEELIEEIKNGKRKTEIK